MSDWWLFPESVPTNAANSSAAFIALTHNLCLLVFVCYKNKTHGLELTNTNYEPSLIKPLYIVTMLTYFGFLFYNIGIISVSLKILYEAFTCTSSLHFAIITYTFSKYTLWLFALMRIRILFHSEERKLFGYTTKTLTIIFIILTVCFIQNIIVFFVATSGREIFINKNTSFCAYVVHYMLLIIYVQLMDQVCTIGCFVLFWNKMRSTNTLEKSQRIDLQYVLRKYTILLATNIFTSWISTLLVTFTPLGIMGGQIDSSINMWSIVLFDSKFDKMYISIFGQMVKAPTDKQLNEPGVEENVDNATTKPKKHLKRFVIHRASGLI
eukprot:UN01196